MRYNLFCTNFHSLNIQTGLASYYVSNQKPTCLISNASPDKVTFNFYVILLLEKGRHLNLLRQKHACIILKHKKQRVTHNTDELSLLSFVFLFLSSGIPNSSPTPIITPRIRQSHAD